ncbi:Signal peptidase II [[Mycoplasma] cavipharyngis]|uniref:signal peptidase II n=1 Tax=[Mycoplasma] cavipharyngis TaxID=92757 RepID=UPI0037039E7D
MKNVLEKFVDPNFWLAQKNNIRNYYFDLFVVQRKKLLINYAITSLVMIIIFGISFGLRQHYLNLTFAANFNQATTKIAANTGISFGLLSNNAAAVYVLQIIPVILTGIILIHNTKYYNAIAVTLVFASGMSNFIDRLVPDYFGTNLDKTQLVDNNLYLAVNAVVDYWTIDNNSIFNFPDVFILIGIGLVVLGSFYFSWQDAKARLNQIKAEEAAESENNDQQKKVQS